MRLDQTALDALVERRIREAQERGDLDDLPGTGAPLALDDDALVPADLRVAYRVLKNAGYVPPEVAALLEARALERALEEPRTPGERERLLARLSALLLATPLARRRGDLRLADDYFAKIAARFARPRKP